MPNGVWTLAGVRTSLASTTAAPDGIAAGDPTGYQGGTDMTRSLVRRSAAGVVAVLALGIAAPVAAAKPIDLEAGGSAAPTSWTQTPATSVDPTAGQPNGGDIPDWAYVAIDSGVTSLALISVGGARTAHRRQRQHAAAPIT